MDGRPAAVTHLAVRAGDGLVTDEEGTPTRYVVDLTTPPLEDVRTRALVICANLCVGSSLRLISNVVRRIVWRGFSG